MIVTEWGAKRRFKSDDKRYFSIPARYRARAPVGDAGVCCGVGFSGNAILLLPIYKYDPYAFVCDPYAFVWFTWVRSPGLPVMVMQLPAEVQPFPPGLVGP